MPICGIFFHEIVSDEGDVISNLGPGCLTVLCVDGFSADGPSGESLAECNQQPFWVLDVTGHRSVCASSSARLGCASGRPKRRGCQRLVPLGFPHRTG